MASKKEAQSNRWRDFRDEFEQLAREEEQQAAPEDRLLWAHITYNEKGKPEQGRTCLWVLNGGAGKNFQKRFQDVAVRAARALGAHTGIECDGILLDWVRPTDVWLDLLFYELRKNNTQLCAESTEGRMILSVCVASARFCSQLETEAGAEAESESIIAAVGPFTHSEDYRSVTVRGETFTLTTEQAQIIEILHEAHKNGNPDISSDYIMERLGKGSSRWQDTFRSSPKAKQVLIKFTRKGTLRLNV